jgi:hypothetical protein
VIRFRVEWVNPRHALLAEAGANIVVSIPGQAQTLAPVSHGRGFREYDVPSTVSEFLLEISFAPELGKVGAAAAMSTEVFKASQRYVVSEEGNHIEAVDMPPFLQPHPLIDSKTEASSNVAVLAQARTEIVDITRFWDHYMDWRTASSDPSESASPGEFRTEREPFVQFVALGYTGGIPLIWFASVPVVLSLPRTTRIGTLVYYRPDNYWYNNVNDRHDSYPLNRFILNPIPVALAGNRYWRMDQIHRDQLGQWYYWLPAGIEQAVSRSNREVLLLLPWAPGSSYGSAADKNLPVVAEQIVRFLYAIQAIALGGFDVSLGRLAIAGYSQGGAILWNALEANRERVDEVYAFDAENTGKQATRLQKWFKSRTDAGRDPRLFFANGIQLGAATAVANWVQTHTQPVPPPNRILAIPRTNSEFTDNSIPSWVHATLGLPGLQNDDNARHQFPVFAHYPRTPGEPAADQPTFLQYFLELSGFQGP